MAQLTNLKIGIVTQARMTSTRLPGKVLMEVAGKPLLQYHIDRLKETGYSVFVATTKNEEDEPILELAKKNDLPCYRGSEYDVLARFMKVQDNEELGIVVRVTSDCPLIDPGLIQRGVELYLEKNDDQLYISNCFPRTYARGFDFEVFSGQMLKEADFGGTQEEDREHVTPYLWKNKPGKYGLHNISQEMQHGAMRITVDTPEDFEVVRILIEQYHADKLDYSQIEKILLEHPDLMMMNAHIEQKKN